MDVDFCTKQVLNQVMLLHVGSVQSRLNFKNFLVQIITSILCSQFGIDMEFHVL